MYEIHRVLKDMSEKRRMQLVKSLKTTGFNDLSEAVVSDLRLRKMGYVGLDLSADDVDFEAAFWVIAGKPNDFNMSFRDFWTNLTMDEQSLFQNEIKELIGGNADIRDMIIHSVEEILRDYFPKVVDELENRSFTGYDNYPDAEYGAPTREASRILDEKQVWLHGVILENALNALGMDFVYNEDECPDISEGFNKKELENLEYFISSSQTMGYEIEKCFRDIVDNEDSLKNYWIEHGIRSIDFQKLAPRYVEPLVGKIKEQIAMLEPDAIKR